MEYATNDNGTITQREYDVLDRVVGRKIGTNPMSMFQVANTYFDSAGGASQGTGDGNVTLSRVHVDNSTTRDTEMKYDFRNRRTATINPDVPHFYTEYDNLDRPTKQIVFKGLLSSLTSALASDDTDRGRWTETSYSQRGLVFRRAIAKDPGLAATGFLETHTWYDQAGRAVGNWSPSSPMVKTTYDAFGRRKVIYLTDRDDDDQPTQAGSHADVYTAAGYVANVGDDNVIEQVEYSYIAGGDSDGIGIGMVDLVTTHRRTHTNNSPDALSEGSGAITTYMGYFYDDANRNIRTVNYGTNNSGGFVHNGGGLVPAPDQTSPPDASISNPELVSATTYNAIGLVDLAKTPRVSGGDPYETKYVYDDLYRQIAVIENYDDITIGGMSSDFGWNSTDGRWEVTGGITDAEPDTDRVTSFVYDGSSNIVKRVAHVPQGTTEEVQVTEYDYDYSLTDVIACKDMLAEVRYPHETSGTAGTTAEYTVTYEYNRLGELTDMTDQNGTLHTYTRDDLGRVTDDFVTFAMSSDIDEWADRIQYEYDDDEWGKLVRVSTFDGGASPTYPDDVLNEVAYEYDNLWQLTSIKLNPMGEVDMSSTTREFTYTYDIAEFESSPSAGHNFTRLSSLGYPQIASETAMTVDPTYPSGVDDLISRATGFGFNVNTSSNNHTVEHEFVGLGMPVITVYPTPGFQLTRFVDPGYDNPGDSDTANGEYPGLDQFGRIKRQVWSGPGVGWGGGSPLNWDPDSLPAIYDLEYTYDYNSNITARTDAREGASINGRDEAYTYDGIDRLTEAERIESGSSTQRALSQDWALDMLGNWDTYNPDLTIGTKEQDRTHNQANEITGITVNSTAWAATEHDKAGNLTYQGTSSNRRRHFVWDAWNRLVQVDYETDSGGWTGDTRATHTYYGGHQRAQTLADEEPDASEDPTRWNAYYYDASWRLLEHRYDDLTSASWTTPPTSFTADETKHYVWGMRYIDELVYYRKAVDEGRYALTDRNFSVIGLMEDDPTDADDERIRYTPYGEATATLRSDVDFDGDVDGTDRSLVNGAIGNSIGAGGYKVEYDVNRDGTIDTTDRDLVTADNGNSITAGQVSAQGNLVGYDGYIFEPSTGMYCVRHRWYLPEVGRWGSRESRVSGSRPIRAYGDGSSLLEYAQSTPVNAVDPTGLIAWYDIVIWGTGGTGKTWLECVGDCIGYWTGVVDEIVAAALLAENAVIACGTKSPRNLNPAPRKLKRLADQKPNTTNWQNIYRHLPQHLKTPRMRAFLKTAGRANLALLFADAAVMAAIEAHCAETCTNTMDGFVFRPSEDYWFPGFEPEPEPTDNPVEPGFRFTIPEPYVEEMFIDCYCR